MVGNSPRSAILPVLALGGSAAYVPARLSWWHEHDEVPSGADSNCIVLTSLLQLPAAVRG
jgi:putative hydrolase of the HAD superfamily